MTKPMAAAGVAPCFQNLTPFILASASPRRQEMLAGLGLSFRVEAAEADERVLDGETPETFVLRVAKDKAMIVAERNQGTWVLAADTVVVLEGEILGKPTDAEEAILMLHRLADREHEVWTGFCLGRTGEHRLCRAVRTAVRFADLSGPEIRAYVRTGDPLDKAGAYGIQSLAAFMVREINGSYTNVVGLPLAEVVAAMTALGLILPASD